MTKEDYDKYDYLIGMDSNNIRNMERILEALNNAKNLLDGYDNSAVSPALKTP